LSSDASSHFTRRAALLGLLGTAGCGFAPVYGPSGQASALNGALSFDTGSGRFGYRLREQFERRLGRAENPRFTLKTETVLSETRVAIAADNTATRINLPANAAYTLTDLEGNVLTSGTVQTFTSYSATGSNVATRAARQAAEDRLATMVGDLVIARILAESSTLPL